MGFGDNYQPREYDQFVPEGDYKVRLGLAQDVERSGYRIREIPIAISGFPGYGPEKWSWFDAPVNDPDKLDIWNKARTRDADAFGVQRGNFDPRAWNGKIGYVHIAKDKNGYMKVVWSIVKADASQSPAPTPAPAPRQGPAARPPVTPQDDFSDDIPF